MHKYISVIVLILVLAVPGGSLFSVDFVTVPPPLASRGSTVPEYQLGFGDVIEVKFFNNQRFNETITVRPDGRISMERMGEVFVAGLTPLQLDSLITREYSKFVQSPDITIILREFGGYQVYVLGQVNAPGGYPVQRNMTLLQAIAAAGGTMDGAKIQSTVVIRRNEKGEIDAFKVDLQKVVKRDREASAQEDIYVQQLDIVYVQKSFVKNMCKCMTRVDAGVIPSVARCLRACR